MTPTLREELLEILAHLGAALAQSIEEDDPIITGHLREAHALLRAFLRAHRGVLP